MRDGVVIVPPVIVNDGTPPAPKMVRWAFCLVIARALSPLSFPRRREQGLLNSYRRFRNNKNTTQNYHPN